MTNRVMRWLAMFVATGALLWAVLEARQRYSLPFWVELVGVVAVLLAARFADRRFRPTERNQIVGLALMACLAGSSTAAHAQSSISRADSTALGRAAARTALQGRSVTPAPCVLSIDDVVGGAVGHAFVAEGYAVARALPSAAPDSGTLSLTLKGVSGRDTMQVRVVLSGTGGAHSGAAWTNDFGYRFTRDAVNGDWHFLSRVPLYFGDFVTGDVPATATAKLHCLNPR